MEESAKTNAEYQMACTVVFSDAATLSISGQENEAEITLPKSAL